MKLWRWVGFLTFFHAALVTAATEKVVVLTSYPQEVITQFESAFEQAYPQYRLEIQWRQSRDAITFLHQPHAPVDVYWSPAQRNFASLAKQGAFRQLDINLSGLPQRIGGFQIADPSGYYTAVEAAGYGIAYHPAELQRLGLPVPQDWKALTTPEFDSHVVLPIPSKVGYAPMLVDTLLQGYGWAQGWQILQQISANAKLADAGATFISDDVGSGRVAVGLTMDFFAASAIANGKPLLFTYPVKVGYSPAHVAIFSESTHLDAAKAFVTFVLSEQGQKLLFHPDIRKLPIRPSVYANKPAGYFDPFAAAQRATYQYDIATGIARQELLGAVFDALITRHHEALKAMWSALRMAQQKAPMDKRLQEALQHAYWLPVSAEQSADETLQRIFFQRGDDAKKLEQQWDIEIAQHYNIAMQIAQNIIKEQP